MTVRKSWFVTIIMQILVVADEEDEEGEFCSF